MLGVQTRNRQSDNNFLRQTRAEDREVAEAGFRSGGYSDLIATLATIRLRAYPI